MYIKRCAEKIVLNDFPKNILSMWNSCMSKHTNEPKPNHIWTKHFGQLKLWIPEKGTIGEMPAANTKERRKYVRALVVKVQKHMNELVQTSVLNFFFFPFSFFLRPLYLLAWSLSLVFFRQFGSFHKSYQVLKAEEILDPVPVKFNSKTFIWNCINSNL